MSCSTFLHFTQKWVYLIIFHPLSPTSIYQKGRQKKYIRILLLNASLLLSYKSIRPFYRLVFRLGFLIFAEISEMLKKNRLEKFVSAVKWSTWLYVSTLQNFASRHLFDVNGVSIVISSERDVETGESMWKVLKTKAWA